MRDHPLLLKIKHKLENNSLHTIKSITTMGIKCFYNKHKHKCRINQ